MVEALATGFIVLLAVEAAVVAGLVGYLLFRPKDDKKKPKLKPEDRVATTYGEPNTENGQVLLDNKDPNISRTPSYRSSASSVVKKPLDVESVTIEVEKAPLYSAAPPTVIQIEEPDDKQPDDKQPDDKQPEDKQPDDKQPDDKQPDDKQPDDKQPDDKQPEVVTDKPPKEDKPSSSSSSSDEEEPTEKDKAPKVSDSSAENKKEEVEEPSVIVVHAPSEEEKQRRKSSSSSSSEEEEEEKEKKKEEQREVSEPLVDISHISSVKKNKQYSFSSSSEEDFITVGKPVPTKRTVFVKKSVQEVSVTSSSAEEEGDDAKKIIKSKKKKKRKSSKESSSSESRDEQIIHHKKKKHRKRIIHNIEEVEIIEEHTINKTHKTIYKKAPRNNEEPRSEPEIEDKPRYVVSRVLKTSTKEGSSSASSSSDDEEVKSPGRDMTYHTEHHFDVARNKDDKYVTMTYFEPPTSPTTQAKYRTYTETIREDKTRNLEMSMDNSSSPWLSEEEIRLRSEKNIPITSTPNFKPFTTTVKVQEAKPEEKKLSSSSSSESDEDEETRKLKSETSINLKTPVRETIIKTEVIREKELVPQLRGSSSSSSESERSREKKSSSALIRLKSPPRRKEEFVVTVVTDGKTGEKAAAPPERRSSSSSSDDEEKKVLAPVTEQPKASTIIKEFEKKNEEEENISSTTVTTEEMIVTTTTREKKPKKHFKFTSGWKRQVTLEDLFKAGVVTQNTIDQLQEGTIKQEEVEKSIQVYLVGKEPIAGLLMSDTGEKVSIYDAWKKGLIRRGTSISLLEAQAATGRIIDPKTADKMSVTEATHKRLIDRQFEAVLIRAERAVYGYKTRLSKETLSLFEAMKRGLVVENHGIRLLEAQIATGGIIDPNANHRLPVEVAYERKLFDQRLHDILEDPSDDTRGLFDPNTEENLTYMELMDRCVIDKDTGLRLLPIRTQRKKPAAKISKVVFESATKRQVYLQDIVEAELVDLKTAKQFDEGQMTSAEVMDMVAKLKVYVDGTKPIAGVISSQTGEKTSVLEACRSGLIRKGTAFELLEAQGACGKIIDVQTGKAVSIETALRTGVIDKEFEDVVSRAHRAVTGYREPFKREVLSLCEAMARHLVVQRHAIRLLEAQIATGGIVDMRSPVRISIAVALKRGLIDKALAEKLDKRTTASYFDPMTGENLNYSELMGRCVLDKDSGLLFLMVEGGTVTQNILPFEPEPETMKIRDKTQAKLTTEVVSASQKKRASTLQRTSSPPPEAVPSSPPAILSRRVVIVDPNTGNELTVKEALKLKLLDEETAKQLMAQEGDFEDEVDF